MTVPIKDFKLLLNYWADETIQAKAEKNKKARSQVTETHTVGPRSFAQVYNKMVNEIAPVDGQVPQVDGQEPPPPISDAAVYIKTRKRDPAREYKLPVEAVEKKIEDVEKLLKAGSIEAANEMVRGEKEHRSCWLVGRIIKQKGSKDKAAAATTSSASSLSDQYIADLTARIRDQLTQEMDENVDKKVRENVKLVISKLIEKNPELKVDINELSAEPSTDFSVGDNVTA